ncbi:MAG TPA: hypothetical protein VIQ99_07850 [Gammaproteobacteria bacterium]
MNKLRTFLAAALLTIPVFSLSASSLTTEAQVDGIASTPSVTGTCYYYIGGRWWAFPC